MNLDDKAPIMVGGQPSLGQRLLSVDYVGPTGPPPIDRHEQLLKQLVTEVHGLRQDLYDRSAAGRCLRLWRWVQRWIIP